MFGSIKHGYKLLTNPTPGNAARFIISITPMGVGMELVDSINDEVGSEGLMDTTNENEVNILVDPLSDSPFVEVEEGAESEISSNIFKELFGFSEEEENYFFAKANQIFSGIGHLEFIETINMDLANTVHPETGVLFNWQEIETVNGVKTGVFPVFDEVCNVVIPKEYYSASDDVHFRLANEALDKATTDNPELVQALGLTNSQLGDLFMGKTPEGYVWHHHEKAGLLQLVNEEVHNNTSHTGGRAIWGGGNDNR